MKLLPVCGIQQQLEEEGVDGEDVSVCGLTSSIMVRLESEVRFTFDLEGRERAMRVLHEYMKVLAGHLQR